MYRTRLKRWFKDGHLFSDREAFEKFKDLTGGHLTFLEAFKKTGRVLCIPVVPDEESLRTPAKCLNYVTV
jgi:hypothetical protein